MYRTFVILRHTFLEAIVQPIYALLLAVGAAILCIFGLLPFFTLGEDTIMFKSVGLDVILLLVLIATLFLSQTLPIGLLQAEVWPATMRAPQKQKALVVSKKKTQKEKERRKRQKRRARERSRAHS